MKPSSELVAAARDAFYNNQGGPADDPFELMLETLSDRGLIELTHPAPVDGKCPGCDYEIADDHHPACRYQ